MLVLWKMHWDRHDPVSACVRVDDHTAGVTIEYILTEDCSKVRATATGTSGTTVSYLELLHFKTMLMQANARDPRSLAGRVRGRLHSHRAADAGYTTAEPLADRPNAQSLFKEHLDSMRAGALDELLESLQPLPGGVA